MKLHLALFIGISALLFSCSEKNEGGAQETKKQIFKSQIDSLLQVYKDSATFMGCVTLLHDGESIYENTIGFSELESQKKPDMNTKYRIGSITKTFTAVLIFKAVEEKKLRLDQTIENYFPQLEGADEITIGQLLHHRSGIFSYTSDKAFFEFRTESKSPDELLALISSYERSFPPDSTAEYSNSGYFLLSQILEKTYNKTYDELLQQKICTPLNLKNTYSGSRPGEDESFSYYYDTAWMKFTPTHLSVATGTGSIQSTSNDLSVFMNGLLTGKLLSDENLELMKTIKDNHGMGIFRYNIEDRVGFGHRGRIDEFRSTSIYFEEEKLVFTLISNGSQEDINGIYTEILQLYFGDALIEVSEDQIKKFSGTYTSQDDPTDQTIFKAGEGELILLVKGEFEEPLIYKGNNRFLFNQVYGESIAFTFSPDGNDVTFEQGDFKATYTKQ